jgi:RNA polymerase sigma-70 factor (family 1)
MIKNTYFYCMNRLSSPNENILFSRIAEDDEKAFSELFNLYLTKLYPFTIRLTRSESAVEEIIQETFIKVWLNRDRLPGMDNPGGWIFTVASNKCYDWLRVQALNNRLFTTATTEQPAVETTHQWLDSKELSQLIQQAVGTLPAQRKKIYLMSRVEGRTIPEIADALDLSPNTVKNALVTSLKTIREFLAEHGITLFILNLLFFQEKIF